MGNDFLMGRGKGHGEDVCSGIYQTCFRLVSHSTFFFSQIGLFNVFIVVIVVTLSLFHYFKLGFWVASSLPLLHKSSLTGAIARPDGEGCEAGSLLVSLGGGAMWSRHGKRR